MTSSSTKRSLDIRDWRSAADLTALSCVGDEFEPDGRQMANTWVGDAGKQKARRFRRASLDQSLVREIRT